MKRSNELSRGDMLSVEYMQTAAVSVKKREQQEGLLFPAGVIDQGRKVLREGRSEGDGEDDLRVCISAGNKDGFIAGEIFFIDRPGAEVASPA